MMSDPSHLSQIQRWMQAVIAHPLGVQQGLDSADARRHVDVGAEDVEQIVSRSNALDSIGRLEVYASAYYARLLECLRDEFPVLTATIGEDAFDELAFEYLQQYPSQSYTLSRLADLFPQYLSESRPPRETEAPDWADLMVDLAELELLINSVFDGPGAEKLKLLSADDLRAIDPERWPDAVLVPVPCLRLLTARFALHDYYTAVRRGESPELPTAEPTYLAVSRRGYIVRRHVLSQPQFELLSALVRGQSIGSAIESVVDSGITSIEALADVLQQWFHTWTSEGFFLKVQTPPRSSQD